MRRVTALLLLSLAACGGDPAVEDRTIKSVAAGVGQGAELFSTVCATCHEVDGGGKQAVGAPAIANLPVWYIARQLTHFRDGVRGAHPDDSEGAMMAVNAQPLDDEQITLVAAYIDTLPTAEPAATLTGDANRGKDHYSNICSACHGSNALGNEALSSPPLAGLDDWYLERQYHKFSAGIRGAHPADQWGVQMVRIAPVLPDDKVLRDVIVWLASQEAGD